MKDFYTIVEYKQEFNRVKLHQFFHLNGNAFVKHTTRTARMLKNGKVFYFGMKTVVAMGKRF